MLTASTVKTCSVCAGTFEPFTSTQVVCSIPCARRIPVINRKAEKAERQETRRKLEALKTRRDYLNEAQAVMNRYVRLRDHGKGCISCGAQPEAKFGGAVDCGHYLSRGASPHLRFHLHNMAAQCVKDNRYLGGVAGKFRLGLIARLGVEKVEALEALQGPAKFTVEYLQRLKRVFARKARRLEKRLGL